MCVSRHMHPLLHCGCGLSFMHLPPGQAAADIRQLAAWQRKLNELHRPCGTTTAVKSWTCLRGRRGRCAQGKAQHAVIAHMACNDTI